MPKHKKTKEQKEKTDQRRVVSTYSPTYTFSSHAPIASASHAAIHTNTIVVARHDLVKTACISGCIVLLQIAFFLLLKNHVLAISFVRY